MKYFELIIFYNYGFYCIFDQLNAALLSVGNIKIYIYIWTLIFGTVVYDYEMFDLLMLINSIN